MFRDVRSKLSIHLFALIASISVLQIAHGQDTVDEQNMNMEEGADVTMIVSKQKSCKIMIKNGGTLKVDQRVKLTKASAQPAFAVVQKLQPNGSAIATLEQNQCSNNLVGAKAQPIPLPQTRSTQMTSGQESPALPPGVMPESSAHERIRRKTTLRLGYGLMFSPGYTFAGSYNASHDLSIEGTLDSAGMNLLDLYSYNRMRIGVLAHYFTSNSFHISGGLVVENLKSSSLDAVVLSDGIKVTKGAFTADIDQMQYQFGIGNRWNLGQFVLGAEWIGYSDQLFNLSETFKNNAALTESSFSESKKSIQNYAATASLRIFNAYVGLSF